MAEPVEVPPIQPLIDDRRELLARIEMLEAENGRLRAKLNDARYLAQRALALLSGGRLLALAALAGAIAAIVLYAGTPIGGILVDAWHALTGTGQPVPHAQVSPLPPFIVADSSPEPSPSTLPQRSPAFLPEPKLVAGTRVTPSPSPSPTSSPLPTCNGNHKPTDPICPPMGHKPSPSPPQ